MTEERKQFGSTVSFILSCVGYAVGLGNIWRFPILAYQNGGGSFIIPYLCCSFFFGLPMLYLELSLGQFSQAGPSVIYGRIRPYAQGIGWGMSTISLLVSIYYNVIVAWTLVFIVSVFTGKTNLWALCGNAWNDENCVSSLDDEKCVEELKVNGAFYFNQSCHDEAALPLMTTLMQHNQSASTQFFENYILQQSDSMEDLGGINWPVLTALIIVWILTALALSQGVKLIGKLAYITATVPYIIIAILFVRSVTLDGAKKGLDFYILKINFSAIFNHNAWTAAATQICYSLAIGFGGLLSLSSYNKRSHNCLRDALIICFCDGFMSVFGGVAVFSVLGFMATKQRVEIDKVINEGVALAFIAYPEAMSRMPWVPEVWAFLFFLMLFLLGISSQFGLAEVMITNICDQFPAARRYQKTVVSVVCFLLFLGGTVMTTRAGVFYFNIFNDNSASFALCILVLFELILISYIYGIRNYLKDLQHMFGPPKNLIGKIFGYSGYYFAAIWTVVAPICITVLLVLMLIDTIKPSEKSEGLEYPGWSKTLVWTLLILPLVSLPLLLIINLIHFTATKKPLRELALPRPEWFAPYENEASSIADTFSDPDNCESSPRKSSVFKVQPIGISSPSLPSDAWTTEVAAPVKST